MRQRLTVILLLAALPLAAAAQLRTIPQDAKRAQIRHVHEMQVILDGVPEQLAAGAQIRDASNRIVVPVALQAGALARYRRNGEGRVHQVWILTAEEAAQPGESK
jgi:hypothetical protein